MGQARSAGFFVLLLALGAGAGAYSRGRDLAGAGTGRCRGAAPAPSGRAARDPGAPARRSRSLTGTARSRKLSEWDGRPQIINFWATWCAPCRREIPMLNGLAREPALAEFALIGIAIDFREDVLSIPRNDADRVHGADRRAGRNGCRTRIRHGVARPAVHRFHRPDRPDRDHPCRRVAPCQADVILSAVRALDAGKIDLAAAREQHPGRRSPKIGSFGVRSTLLPA